jgi:hypothetical protein
VRAWAVDERATNVGELGSCVSRVGGLCIHIFIFLKEKCSEVTWTKAVQVKKYVIFLLVAGNEWDWSEKREFWEEWEV